MTLRHTREVRIRPRLERGEARKLVKAGMDTAVTSPAFRDLVLAAAVEGVVVDRLTTAGRHRLALAMLDTWGGRREWRRLYGTATPLDERMRRVLLGLLREQARPRTVDDFVDDASSMTRLKTLGSQQALAETFARIQIPALAVSRAVDAALAPLRDAFQRIGDWLARITVPLRTWADQVFKAPAIRQAVELLNKQVDAKRVAGPVAKLLEANRSSASTVEELLRRMRQASLSPVVPPTPGASRAHLVDESAVVEVVVPDEAVLTAFFAEERGDRTWRRGPLGWLLRVVPLSVGGLIHDRLRDSPEAALAWMAERLLSHELRRVLEPALDAVPCAPATRDVLLAGIDHFLRRDWAVADTLLTTGLDGLLLGLAFERGVVTEGRKLRRSDGKPGREMRTAGNSDLLRQLGFDGSQIAFLTNLSLGRTGNPPRHGTASPIGSDRHAAGSLLGLLLVLSWYGQRRTMVAGLLAAS